MASIASAGSASLTSIFGTIATVANTAQRSVHTLASGLDMLDTYVASARNNQVAKHKISASDYLENLILESSLEQAKREQIIAKQLTDVDLKSRFDIIEARNRSLFAEAQP